mmetsp:Transcript_9096/g.26839  ORF Transcript_9096/g.26839 Transcript_9096/m.26839 type:complete len:207 (-) Transcript_9096:475-1095(-)
MLCDIEDARRLEQYQHHHQPLQLDKDPEPYLVRDGRQLGCEVVGQVTQRQVRDEGDRHARHQDLDIDEKRSPGDGNLEEEWQEAALDNPSCLPLHFYIHVEARPPLVPVLIASCLGVVRKPLLHGDGRVLRAHWHPAGPCRYERNVDPSEGEEGRDKDLLRGVCEARNLHGEMLEVEGECPVVRMLKFELCKDELYQLDRAIIVKP